MSPMCNHLWVTNKQILSITVIASIIVHVILFFTINIILLKLNKNNQHECSIKIYCVLICIKWPYFNIIIVPELLSHHGHGVSRSYSPGNAMWTSCRHTSIQEHLSLRNLWLKRWYLQSLQSILGCESLSPYDDKAVNVSSNGNK